ncbi:N-acyl-D-amino-acid deacylase family protein [Paenibacillus beijingensis]|uniref:Amidohydrolase 3 domain-containing protein n=1 Tax=Paenibacillus beijingensis TaxID=1126833 RepID=A0A0D5NNP2_9BACL|nr:D-aminoacylase [Paenibacillus beijingensis]AJY76770.1 hypothetical protein VN24_22125 [Paenibacillus beijingensis]
MYDLIIQSGCIVDGSGAPWYRADIAVKDGIIAKVGNLKDEAANRYIIATGLIVAPGFIDIHSHDDLHILENPFMETKVRQGVTTTVIGNCGFGLYPVLPVNEKLFREYAIGLFGEPERKPFGFAQFDGFIEALNRRGAAVNVSSFVAHGVLRVSVMGFDNRKPTNAELDKMKSLLRQALRSGSVGMSLGLVYPPGSYADTEELIELSKVVAVEGGIVSSHIRNEAGYLLDSLDEMLTLAKEANVPLEISHLKAIGFSNFGKAKEALRKISTAKNEGVDVTFDQYPYPSGSTTATRFMPPWALEGGIKEMLQRIRYQPTRERIIRDIKDGIPNSRWEPMWKVNGWKNMMICSVEKPENKTFEGRNVEELANQLNQDPITFMLNLLDDEEGRVMMINFQQDKNDLEAIMTSDLQMFGSDGLPLRGKKAHPRLYGSFARVLGTYVREHGLLTLERAVMKMTYMPANRLGLFDRGLIRPGMAADLTIFNRQTITDLASYTNPAVHPKGIETVIVNGALVLENGSITGELPGKALRSMCRN